MVALLYVYGTAFSDAVGSAFIAIVAVRVIIHFSGEAPSIVTRAVRHIVNTVDFGITIAAIA